MSLRLTFAGLAPAIADAAFGEQAPEAVSFQKVMSFHEAITIVRAYLEQRPTHEASIGSTVTSHRITPPAGQGFGAWLAKYQETGVADPVRPGMTFGEVIAALGWPDDCSLPMTRSPLSVILRYQPGDVDFHFDAGGLLWLVHRDDLYAPATIVRA